MTCLLARLTRGIVILAVLTASIAPAFGYAVALANLERGVEICTSAGLKRIPASDDSSGQPGAAHAFEHCPYCTLRAPLLGPPPAAGLMPPPALVVHGVALALPDTPRFLAVWSSAQPRAPPPSS